ncbi:hypothetical protein V500_05065 [Pseudogymnoascus sp. VKM F-4518 (FW-2643)]|nr:hypothetical protein V500_05065 [Pseudogymnoascus sp. VKM F-4518 (FW-2643)]
MGRPVLTADDRLAIARGRGYTVQSTLDRQNQLKETEQSSLAGATEEKHEDVEKVWQDLHVILKSENRLMYNGLMFFFSLAIADNAIKGYDTLDALMKARVLEGRDSWELKWKEEACELPVLRMASVVSLGHDVGYRDALKIHAICAGVANKIKDHEGTGIYNKAYESKIVKGYGFSMFKGDDAPTDNIETLQSMDHRRDGNAPKDLLAKEKAEFFQRSDV